MAHRRLSSSSRARSTAVLQCRHCIRVKFLSQKRRPRLRQPRQFLWRRRRHRTRLGGRVSLIRGPDRGRSRSPCRTCRQIRMEFCMTRVARRRRHQEEQLQEQIVSDKRGADEEAAWRRLRWAGRRLENPFPPRPSWTTTATRKRACATRGAAHGQSRPRRRRQHDHLCSSK